MSTAEWGFGWLNIVPATGTRDQSSRNRMQRAYPTICLVSYTNRRKFEERRGRKRFGTNQGIGYSIASRVIKNYTRALTHGWGTKSIPSVVCSAIPPCDKRKAWLEQDSKKKVCPDNGTSFFLFGGPEDGACLEGCPNGKYGVSLP